MYPIIFYINGTIHFFIHDDKVEVLRKVPTVKPLI